MEIANLIYCKGVALKLTKQNLVLFVCKNIVWGVSGSVRKIGRKVCK